VNEGSRRVLVTRAVHQASKLSTALAARGLKPVEVPVLEIQPPLSYAALDAALRELDSFDWLIVTSANTVEALTTRAAEIGEVLTTCPAQIAAVGEATAKAVRKIGLEVALVPEKYVAESLVELLARQVAGKRVLLAKAEVARDVIPEALHAAGASLVVADAYRNGMPAAAPNQLRAALEAGIDAVTFTSSSSVRHLADAAQAAGFAFPFAGVKAVSIGPITSATLSAAGWEPAAEANPSDIPGLVAATAQALGLA
jgi:uroporphyrinogen-III synthase/uroporphyrinogen III methyltransferase/synthase